ncbi:uncharacterized protein LOC126373391 isoform X2 [Pectinophora gossypiella]|uniref:uncharacterized protein LOC126373391 isoform X2 n=1 Tax=Pectinophora gossypiella TaxID=13191 RepID=UPI00214EA9A1|nr:uncharacterized protein LOC126373391 isoform X2 [Pectinophora gossypiella]
MFARLLLLCLLGISCVNCEYLFKKLCSDDPHQCEVYNVILDPCEDGKNFCTINKLKHYTLSIDFLPKFSANKLNMSMLIDDKLTDTFDGEVKVPSDACEVLTCPVDAQTRRLFDVRFKLGKSIAVGKYPVKMKLFNSENEKQSCCFTFNVKIKK